MTSNWLRWGMLGWLYVAVYCYVRPIDSLLSCVCLLAAIYSFYRGTE